MRSSRKRLHLTAEEEKRLLVGKPKRLHMEKDGSLVAEEEYFHPLKQPIGHSFPRCDVQMWMLLLKPLVGQSIGKVGGDEGEEIKMESKFVSGSL
ncbi:hypothetical protein ACLB2K_046919 [Fragaria x ananassa]